LDPPQKLLIKGGLRLQPKKIFRQTMTAFDYFLVRRLKRRLEASIPFFYTNSNELYNIRHFVAFPAVGGIPSCPKGTNSINN
ncbi:MAG: hypothetical protein PVH61_39475, partial [Candidatus Aminicenantes bacterium]